MTATEATVYGEGQPMTAPDIFDALDRVAAEDAVVAAGYQPTPERVQAEVDYRRAQDHASWVRHLARAAADESPEGRAYFARFMAEVESRLEAGR